MNYYCVVEDTDADEEAGRWTAHGYTSEDEANAFSDGIMFAASHGLKNRGVYYTSDEGSAISLAKGETK